MSLVSVSVGAVALCFKPVAKPVSFTKRPLITPSPLLRSSPEDASLPEMSKTAFTTQRTTRLSVGYQSSEAGRPQAHHVFSLDAWFEGVRGFLDDKTHPLCFFVFVVIHIRSIYIGSVGSVGS